MFRRDQYALCIVLTNGLSCKFDLNVLDFLRSNLKSTLMFLLIRPPYTTGVAELLEQVNQRLYNECRNVKTSLFSSSMTINREHFLIILADLWPNWVPKETINCNWKTVSISSSGLNGEWIQQEKFEQAAACMETNQETTSSKTLKVSQHLVILLLMFARAVQHIGKTNLSRQICCPAVWTSHFGCQTFKIQQSETNNY